METLLKIYTQADLDYKYIRHPQVIGKSVVYKLVVDGVAYYGSAKSINLRMQIHVSCLRHDKHWNKAFAAAVKEHGYFELHVLHRNEDRDRCYDLENKHIAEDPDCMNTKTIDKSNPLKSSCVRGVCWHKASKSFQVRVFKKGKRIVVGYFKFENEAIEALYKFKNEGK